MTENRESLQAITHKAISTKDYCVLRNLWSKAYGMPYPSIDLYVLPKPHDLTDDYMNKPHSFLTFRGNDPVGFLILSLTRRENDRLIYDIDDIGVAKEARSMKLLITMFDYLLDHREPKQLTDFGGLLRGSTSFKVLCSPVTRSLLAQAGYQVETELSDNGEKEAFYSLKLVNTRI